MFEKILGFVKKVIGIFTRAEAAKISEDVKVSDKMAEAINAWFLVFYNEPPWKSVKQTKFAAILSGYVATLATNEISINTGIGARAEYLKEQLNRFVLPDMYENVQKAAVGGWAALKPYVHNRSIFCETITADRFYPTRIVGRRVEACFFTSFAKVNGKEVVRVEAHDLQPDGVYIQNRAYYREGGGHCPLEDVPEWVGVAPDILINNVEIPLYAVLRMPFTNTIDHTSPLPVSLYANSMSALEELDRLYSEFLWEIHTGKRRQIFDRTAIMALPPGMGLSNQDLATDQYMVINMGNDVKKPYDDYTPDMRVDAYQKAIDIQLRLIETQCGISSGTFTFDIRTGTVKTATEVLSQDRTSYNTTRAIQDRGMQQPIEDLVMIYDVYTTLYGLAPTRSVKPTVTFGDSIFESEKEVNEEKMAQLAAGILRPELYMSWYYGVGKDEAAAMIPDTANV